MRRDISTVAGVFIIVLVSVAFGFIILKQGQSISDTVQYAPGTLQDLQALQRALRAPEPSPTQDP